MLHPRLLEEYGSLSPEAQCIGIYVLDRDGVFVAVNGEACRLLRQDRAELIGTKIVKFYRNPGHRGVFMDKLRKGEEHSFVLDFAIGGQQAYLLDQARLILDGSEEIGVLGFLSDITDKEQALRLVERVPTGVYIADADGVLRYANSGLAEMLGVGASRDLIGRRVGDFYAEKDELRTFTARLSDALREKREEVEGKLFLVREGKTRFPALVKVFPFKGPDGRVPWREGIVTDISKLVEYEQYLVSLPGFYRLERDAGGVFRVEMAHRRFVWGESTWPGVVTCCQSGSCSACRGLRNLSRFLSAQMQTTGRCLLSPGLPCFAFDSGSLWGPLRPGSRALSATQENGLRNLRCGEPLLL